MTARQAALSVLVRVVQQKAYANLCIKTIAPQLQDARERALCTTLVYGVLEHRVHLGLVLQKFCRMDRLPPQVVEALYLGAYQILFLDGVPDSAAVSESVNLVRKKTPRLAGLVNAVLRNVTRTQKEALDMARDARYALQCARNLTPYLASQWRRTFGDAPIEPPGRSTGIRLRDGRQLLPLCQMLEQAGAQVSQPFEGCLRLRGAGDLTVLPLYQAGAFVIQSTASQLIAHALGAQAGMRVLDVCAAPGGKSFAIADDMGGVGRVVSLDLHAHRVSLIRQEALRLGIHCIQARQADATALDDSYESAFDAVLVDAPCSGLAAPGKPEIALRTEEKDIASLAATQAAILQSAAKCVRPGGVLLYSTCTWTHEENAAQVERFLAQHPQFRAGGLSAFLPARYAAHVTEDCFLQLVDTRDEAESFFMARFIRE
jgi:16S rRNA (cytosine967-C5)-methyltransferase